jgi:hypothetical protein
MVRQLSPAALQIGADTIMNSLNYALLCISWMLAMATAQATGWPE